MPHPNSYLRWFQRRHWVGCSGPLPGTLRDGPPPNLALFETPYVSSAGKPLAVSTSKPHQQPVELHRCQGPSGVIIALGDYPTLKPFRQKNSRNTRLTSRYRDVSTSKLRKTARVPSIISAGMSVRLFCKPSRQGSRGSYFTKEAVRRLLPNEQEVSRAQVGLSEIPPGPQCWCTTSSTVGSVSSVQRNERLRKTNGTVSAAPIPGRHRSSRRGGRISLRASEVSSVGQGVKRPVLVRQNVLRPLTVQGIPEPRTAVIYPAKPALCLRCPPC